MLALSTNQSINHFIFIESMHTDQPLPDSIQDPVHMAENGEQVNNMSRRLIYLFLFHKRVT